MIHVAILREPYLGLVLQGRKTIEMRLTRTRCEPFGRIEAGQRLYFKRSGGRFEATAVVKQVICDDAVTPAGLAIVKRKYNDRILGDEEFWKSRRDATFLTLVVFGEVERIRYGPRMDPHYMKGWQCLPDGRDVYPRCLLKDGARRAPSRAALQRTSRATSPTVETFPIRRVLTKGNLRNHHVYLREAVELFPAQCLGGPTSDDAAEPVTLEFDDGTVVRTDVVRARKLFRARAPWGQWFARRRARVGDVVIIERQSARRYAVRLKTGRSARG